jgi:hypothetical protein
MLKIQKVKNQLALMYIVYKEERMFISNQKGGGVETVEKRTE